MDKGGNQDTLRFPPFHEEILQHARWDATEVYGRIRVVISEGFARQRRSPPFERVRDLIVFSFQHAPLRKYAAVSEELLPTILTRTAQQSWSSRALHGQTLACGSKVLALLLNTCLVRTLESRMTTLIPTLQHATIFMAQLTMIAL